MKHFRKYFIRLLLFGLILLASASIIVRVTGLNALFSDVAVLTFFFTTVTFIALAVFLRGQLHEPESQTLYSLFSFSLKFLLDLILVLIWLIVLKKTAATSVIMFFLIYLSFTLFLVFTVLNTLKNKSL